MQEIERVDMVDEEWRDIPNFEMYQISNYGRVFTKYKNNLVWQNIDLLVIRE